MSPSECQMPVPSQSTQPLSVQVKYFPPEHEKRREVRDCGILWLSVTGRNKTVPRSVVSNLMLSLPGLVPPTPTVNREGGSQQSIGVIVMSFYICDWWLETKSNHTTSSSCVLVCCEGYTQNISATNQYKLGYSCKHFSLIRLYMQVSPT